MSAGSPARRCGVAAALACASCARPSAPAHWLPEPKEAESTAYGGWIEVDYSEGQEVRRAAGELIAASADSLWVLDTTRPLVISTAAVRSGKLFGYSPRTGNLAGWTVAGVVSTISNGVFLVITAPLWAITGGIAIGSEVRAARRDVAPLGWAELRPFARFPQGMPDVALDALRAKPARRPCRKRAPSCRTWGLSRRRDRSDCRTFPPDAP
ncbi:MAG TPA: hypothetical protein VF061_12290, partial [Gemmatimonadales bacterium]